MECEVCGFDNEPGAQYCGNCGELLGGRAMLGPYELLGELGRGAMARVWRAWDPNLGREVAIKEPLFDSQLGDGMLQEMGRRFVREAQTAARLSHPGIVGVYAADVYGDRPAIVMELVEGSTLGDVLESGPLSAGFALDVLDQLLDAVGYAHRQGVVHRDIKPDNIFIDAERNVKLADFGIAYVDDDANHATMVGAVLGSPGYMSPEQARGAAVDARSDLFSIGVVAYEMLTGRNPFGVSEGADATTLLYRIVHEPTPELPESCAVGLASGARQAVMAALEKDPLNRPQSAAEFKEMLHAGSYGATGEQGQGDTDEPRGRLSSLPYIVVAVCAIALLALFFGARSGGGGGGGASGGASGGSAASVARSVQGAQSVSSSSSAALSSSASASSSESAFVGTWSVVEVVVDGETAISRSDMEALREYGDGMSFVLNADGSASLTAVDDTFYGSWSASTTATGTITLANRTEGDAPIMTFENVGMTLTGDELLLEQNVTRITCERA